MTKEEQITLIINKLKDEAIDNFHKIVEEYDDNMKDPSKNMEILIELQKQRTILESCEIFLTLLNNEKVLSQAIERFYPEEIRSDL